MNEEFDQNEEMEQKKGGGGSNPAKKVGDTAQNIQDVAQKGSNVANKSAEYYSKKALDQTGKKAVESKLKSESRKKMAESLSKVAAKAGKVTNVASKLAPILATAAVVIIILIIVIGLLVFIITGLGFIMSGLKAIASSFGNAMYNFFYDSGENIPDEKIVDTIEYLDEMGYDLYGYGFVGRDAANVFEDTKDKEGVTAKERLVEEYDMNNFFKGLFDVSNTADTDQYRNILAYLYSDNYTYLVRNNNQTMSDRFKSIFSDKAFGKGLISLYHDSGTIGDIGEAYSSLERGYITADAEEKILTVKKGWFNTAKIEYSLDGWTGRYGMPLEFLLATHIATMAPDLSYKLSTSFETEVQILLQEVDTDIDAAVIPQNDEQRIEKSRFNVSGILGTLEYEDVYKILHETSLKSYRGDNERYNCTGPEPWEYVEGINNHDLFTNETRQNINTLEDAKKNLNSTEFNGITVKSKLLDFLQFDKQLLPVEGTDAADFTEHQIYFGSVASEGISNLEDMVNELLSDETYNSAEWKDNGTGSEYKNCVVKRESDKFIYKLTLSYWVSQNGDPTVDVKCRLESKSKDSTIDSNTLCSDEANDTNSVCYNCYCYVSDIYSALDTIKVEGATTYVPYIYQVKDHWFRDVYFTKDATDGKVVVATDDEYEKKTGERWTLYETYKDDAGNEQYELYVYLKDGNDYSTEFKQASGKYVVCKDVGSGNGDYKLDDDGTTYKKSKGGKYKLQLKDSSGNYSDYSEKPDEFRVGKKAKMDDLSDWNGAYASELDYSENSWEALEIDENSPQLISNLNDLGLTFQYKMNSGSINQTADAVRGETNAKIKKLFLDEYYLYDGTKETAAAIDQAKSKVKIIKNNPNYNGKYDDLDVDDPDSFRTLVKDGVYKDKISYGDVTKNTTIDQISGPISLTHSSLNAFSILKNMHTLDAEYIYHDFKELIVELNYFDKEDLVEAEDEVMMFPVAGLSAAGWPVVRYDKSEDFYGTLIHSATDLKARKAETEAELAELVGQNDSNEEPLNESNISSNPSNSNVNESGNTTYSDNIFLQAAEDIHKYMEDNQYTYCVFGGNSYEECAGSSHGLEETFEKSQKGKKHACCATYVKWVCKAIGIEEITSDSADGLLTECESSDYFEVIGYSTNALQAGDIVHRSHHVQIFAGYDSSGNMTWYNAGSGNSIRKDSPYTDTDTNWDKIMRIKKWDGLEYNGTSGGSSSSTENAEFEGYAGSTDDAPEYVLAPVTGEVIKYGTVERTNLELIKEGFTEKEAKQTVGFIKIRVLGAEECEAGSKDGCEYFAGGKIENGKKAITKKDIEENNAIEWLEDNYEEKYKDKYEEILDKLGYDYFWEEYNDAGIAGNVLYIEGFDVSDIFDGKNVDKSQNASGNIKKLSEYIADEETSNSYSTEYTVPNLLDDKREFELKIAEAAKEKAAYTVSKGGKIYIKEGAVIGKTYSSDDENITKEVKLEVIDQKAEEEKEEKEQEGQLVDSNDTSNSEGNSEENSVATKKKKYKIGNYMRIIMRDTKDEVVENVEDYIEIGEGKKNQQFDAFSVIGTVLSKDEWVKLVVAYANEHNADAIFKNTSDMGEFYDICVNKGVNPEWAFLKAIQEQGLHSDNGNYWGLGVSNGSGAVSYGDWKTTLQKFCDTIVEYQDPTSDKYQMIMEKYEERKACTENGGCDPMGYGTPDTASGIQSIYSFLGKHEYGSAGSGGYYYMDPDRAGVTKIYKTHDEFVTKCQNAGGVHASGTVTTTWEQAGYTAWQVEDIIQKGKEIFGEVAGTYAGT